MTDASSDTILIEAVAWDEIRSKDRAPAEILNVLFALLDKKFTK